MIRNLSLSFAVSILLLMLVSCATVKEQKTKETGPITREPAGWSDEKQKRQQITNWEIRGRLGVQTESNGGSLDIIWKQSGDDFTIHLIAPLGGGSHHIQGEKNYAVIRFPDGEKKTVDDIDEVFATVLEVDLPASAIKDWVRGLPASVLSQEYISWNKNGQLDRLKQSGWNVHLNRYSGSSTLLPHALYLNRDDNDELDIRLILRQWLVDH